ncbi:helix-turn-helix domain-containing protein [Novilysobacter selenitireducens]|uniref:Helix-turn-helix domain-containing protein n=1 Tax=Novilysobacter selenitireducens TaxID=2872639 RepID=A0ABS7T9V0_9GAMM|nr:helix-turn-helix domain-containing protein [Lysobacter selenitireducens]MBZ4040605.1 helix-turn-helix domain-containing protein [Lysobacter selenitireducens]
MEHVHWSDRGQQVQADPSESGGTATQFIGVSRLGSAQLGARFTVLMQVRGSSWVESKEGRFRLTAGDWLALDKESRPLIQTDRDGLTIGLALGTDTPRQMARYADAALYAGRGRVSARDLRTALRLWRDAADRVAKPDADAMVAMRPLLMHLASIQRDLGDRVARCPGRSRTRKRQVFGRLQRARLYMEGNCDRIVRISELAELTSFSSWYFSKTFQSLYDESPQAAAARMRLEHAARLLRESDMMIGEVAAASGFDNCCSFARAFRARFGTSATRYRAAGSARTHSAKSSDVARKAMLRHGT